VEPLLKYFPLLKVDESAHMVWGLVTSEAPDSDKEICDYAFAKAAIQKWSDETLAKTTAAGQDPSLGNMRVMHQLQIGGKAIKIEYKDAEKQVWVGSEPANDEVWHLLKGGFLTAHSIGGSYAWRKPEGEYERYGPTINEISYVDRGANPEASFSYVKADGTTELRKFAKPGPEEEKILRKMKESQMTNLSDEDIARIARSLAESLSKGVKYLVPDGKHLPYTDESGKPSHSHMGAAWAALHGGYRGNKYEGPGKEEAIAHLKEIYRQEGMEPPSSKAILAELEKLNLLDDSELDTGLTKISAVVAELMGKLSAAKEQSPMKLTAEQIKKCADALGVTVEEFEKTDIVEKAKHGIAALHSHLETAKAHHDGMMKAHESMASMHEKHSAHLDKCMKACKAVMGDDEKEADKAIKSLLADLTKVETTDDSKAGISAEEMQKRVDEAVKKAIGELPETQKLRIVPRDSGELVKRAEARDAVVAATSPY